MRVLIEAAGSPIWGTLLPYLRPVAEHIVALDIDPLAFGLYEADAGYLVPAYAQPDCFERLREICRQERIDTVFPTINEGLHLWDQYRDQLAASGITVVLSPAETLATCQDKWETYQFFRRHGIPTPATSLEPQYPLLKPRIGRGGTGIRTLAAAERPDMTDCITQQLLIGQEYSIDALCSLTGEIIYVVPRQRLKVESGLSVHARVSRHAVIEAYTRQILAASQFVGPINLQCFDTDAGVFFTEINPRIAGGMSLALAATENWFAVLAAQLAGDHSPHAAHPVNYELVMMRYYRDCLINASQLLKTP